MSVPCWRKVAISTPKPRQASQTARVKKIKKRLAGEGVTMPMASSVTSIKASKISRRGIRKLPAVNNFRVSKRAHRVNKARLEDAVTRLRQVSPSTISTIGVILWRL